MEFSFTLLSAQGHHKKLNYDGSLNSGESFEIMSCKFLRSPRPRWIIESFPQTSRFSSLEVHLAIKSGWECLVEKRQPSMWWMYINWIFHQRMPKWRNFVNMKYHVFSCQKNNLGFVEFPQQPVMRKFLKYFAPQSSQKSWRTPLLTASLMAKSFSNKFVASTKFSPTLPLEDLFSPQYCIAKGRLKLSWPYSLALKILNPLPGSLREVCQSLTVEMKIAKLGFSSNFRGFILIFGCCPFRPTTTEPFLRRD